MLQERFAMKYVSYLRVSTSAQGIDGNGIAAQKKAVDSFADAEAKALKVYDLNCYIVSITCKQSPY